MRWSVILLFLLFSFKGNCQELKLGQWFVGLGSNRYSEEMESVRGCTDQLLLTIQDTVLTYSVCEPTEKYLVDPEYNDSIRIYERHTYKRIVPKTVVDSVRQIVDTLIGKHVFATDPYVSSGGIFHLIVEGEDWCTHFELKNTFHPVYISLLTFMNSYLNEEHRFHLSNWLEHGNKKEYTQISSCPNNDDNGSYREVLGKEYDLIRESKGK